MIQQILTKDTQLFYFINSLRSEFLDYFFSLFSSNFSFILILFFVTILLSIKQFKQYFWVIIILIALSFFFADRISVMCFKDVFERLRPSHALENVNLVRLKGLELQFDYKGGLYGFVSSHSANAFSLATIFAFIGRKYKWIGLTMFSWAIIVGYSRIYCGVHYPLDVVCGGLLGVLIGLFIYWIYSTVVNKFFSDKKDFLL